MAQYERYPLVVVSNRLPVDASVSEDGAVSWSRSPGGLVTALEPVMRAEAGAWVGWPGAADLELAQFDSGGIHIVPVELSSAEVERYYEGFSNDTLWPLYHDVIAPPSFHREWWECYVEVNRRFAERVAMVAADGATVWVHDYQLQLVPRMLREMRADLTIGFFNHIPFPSYGIFAQLPWRTQIIRGLLGADVIGFQRTGDASNFLQAARRLLHLPSHGSRMAVPIGGGGQREVLVRAFPISIDTAAFEALARTDEIRQRAREIRAGLGEPQTVLLGVDRLDYTKGIGHRLKAFGELLDEGAIHAGEVVLIQVASPSRERVAAYIQLRDEIELTVGRINGEHSTVDSVAVSYLHQNASRDEMAALYLAADVMLVTSLRDGMNLVAKEYVASRFDEDGVLVLSEFTGAADELRRAIQVNPHDIEGLKEAIVRAVRMAPTERRSRMRSMRRYLAQHDVAAWSNDFLTALQDAADGRIP